MTAAVLTAVLVALVAGPRLARAGLRHAARYRTPAGPDDPEADLPPVPVGSASPVLVVDRPGQLRVVVVTVVLAGLLAGAVLLVGPRPFLLALVWSAGAGVVLAQVDLAVHRLPDRIVYPSLAVTTAAGFADAVVLGSWGELLRALLAGLAACTAAAVVGTVSPRALGFGDVKLLGLLGVLLGWFGWSVLVLAVLLGCFLGAVVSLVLIAARRASWRTEIALGPSLLAGAVLALGLPGVLPGA
ncbi:A24 family peptidase [Geodermatophilus sp. YIM 151500]|uniref:prepilin peptidase n=1 Tax=Geodermatophilus sp. YIM 151500 TaxID=2984531 RepID=UPI0021E49B08|nr:A24 family peptidase [Geodermatophilus sp. YIM 151500]MCV2491455.1 A24 family peptidase [Geodermatophilus sp. YIM 151500]